MYLSYMEPTTKINIPKISKDVEHYIIAQIKQDTKDTRHKIFYMDEAIKLIKSIL